MKPRHQHTAGLLAAVLGLLLTGCSDDILTGEPDEEMGMVNTVAFTLGRGVSRGMPVESVEDIKDFRADAYLQRAGDVIPYFHNVRHFPTLPSQLYRSEELHLWPNEAGDQMTFVAVAPYETAQGLTLSGEGNFAYTVPQDVREQSDLLYAKVESVECPQPGSTERAPVQLNFRHLLTQVRFVFGANVENYWRQLTVHSVRIENVSATGTWDAVAGTWGDLDAPTHTFEIAASNTGAGTGERPYGSEETEIWEKEYTMFLMPQTVPAGARVVVDMSYKPNSSVTDTSHMVRDTLYLYLDGKKLEPGHKVTVEINSNYTDDCRVVNLDGSDVDLYPLSGSAQEVSLKLLMNAGGGGMRIKVLPECRGYARVSSPDSQAEPDSVCDVQSIFRLHVDENPGAEDRFIRLVLYEGHSGDMSKTGHYVVLKQRGKTGDVGLSDELGYEDRLMPWGFQWPQPMRVEFIYSYDFVRNFDFDNMFHTIEPGWVSKSENGILFDYDGLRGEARRPNSASDGLANTRAINSASGLLQPFHFISYVGSDGSYEDFEVNGTAGDESTFVATNGVNDESAVMEAVRLNQLSSIGGIGGTWFVRDEAVVIYLPAIEELETIAGSGASSLVAGRTYWSSTVDADGEPLALTVNADGSTTRSKPGAGSQAYVHPVRGM